MNESVFKKKDGIVTRTIAGETILVPVYGDLADIQKIFSVDPVAGFIWDNIDGRLSHADLLARVTDEYQVEHDVADHDLREFLTSLKTAGLILEV